MRSYADLSPRDIAEPEADFLEALETSRWSGSDWGSYMIAAASHPERIGRWLITSSQAYERPLPGSVNGRRSQIETEPSSHRDRCQRDGPSVGRLLPGADGRVRAAIAVPLFLFSVLGIGARIRSSAAARGYIQGRTSKAPRWPTPRALSTRTMGFEEKREEWST
jgi:hypothetical protein